jgi:hypothetical protein
MRASMKKLKHGVLIAFGVASTIAGVVYEGSIADTHLTSGLTVGVVAGLCIVLLARLQAVFGRASEGEISAAKRIVHAVSAVAGMLVPLFVLVRGELEVGSQAFIVAGYASALAGDLAKLKGIAAGRGDFSPAERDQGVK